MSSPHASSCFLPRLAPRRHWCPARLFSGRRPRRYSRVGSEGAGGHRIARGADQPRSPADPHPFRADDGLPRSHDPRPRQRQDESHSSGTGLPAAQVDAITTPWNDTLTPMSSQLPAPEPGRPAADIPADDNLGLQPDPQGLLRTISQWYHHHPMIADTLIAGGIVLLNLIMMYLSLKGPDADANTTLHLPITLSTLGLCGVLLALRRHYPIRVWAALTIVLEIYSFAQIHVYHLSEQQRVSMSPASYSF